MYTVIYNVQFQKDKIVLDANLGMTLSDFMMIFIFYIHLWLCHPEPMKAKVMLVYKPKKWDKSVEFLLFCLSQAMV